jgi:hypothetical protein
MILAFMLIRTGTNLTVNLENKGMAMFVHCCGLDMA